jgi:hypothetical protein
MLAVFPQGTRSLLAYLAIVCSLSLEYFTLSGQGEPESASTDYRSPQVSRRRVTCALKAFLFSKPPYRFPVTSKRSITSPSPSHSHQAVDLAASRRQAPGHLSFLLHTVTGLHRPRLQHYYGFICHLAPHMLSLSFLLSSSYWLPISIAFTRDARADSARLPRLLPAPWNRLHPQSRL